MAKPWSVLFLVVSSAFGTLALDLSGQGWSYVPQEFDSGVTSFTLTGNNISIITPTSFARYKDLVEIIIDRNPLRVIMEGAFDNNLFLEVLKFRFCELRALTSSFGPSTPYLREMSFRKSIRNPQLFSNDYFRNFTSLSYLEVSTNKLENILTITWPPSLKRIGLSSMGFRSFPNLTKWRLPALEKIDMPNNINPGLGEIQAELIAELSDSVKFLVLPWNGITSLPDIISNKPNLLGIWIDGNLMTTIPNMLQLNLRALAIASNPIVCDNRMCWRRMWQWVKPLPRVNDDVNCASPPAFKGQTLMSISPKELRCYEGRTNYVSPGEI